MCAFVLVAGVHRVVPAQARVMVHQIWLGDRREDPTAATYSAEDLVLVQRDIGKLAQYTAEMGASIELLDLALRIPPWEPMHALTQAEIADAHVATEESTAPATAAVAVSPPAPAIHEQLPRMTDGVRASAISEQRWAVVDRKGSAALARRHPLTIGGEDIGSFDLMVACGPASDSYDVSYIERRRGGRHAPLPGQLGHHQRGGRQQHRQPEGGVDPAPQRSRRARHLRLGGGAGEPDRRLRRRRQSLDDGHHQERRDPHRHPSRQYRGAAELAAARRDVPQGARRPRVSAGASGRRIGFGEVVYCAACLRLASIWSSAETTASKVSMVEAWRAL